ncbi:phospholipase D family protein [Roseomonas sp. KE0001]|uniref:phospholipase D family protein n=1 Tax=unclassified Roseomonas TaxID=2617492 RepID=UPI0018DFC515|nr:phospholipase D family protein [Roseomonas sp. KE0001]MBI0433184.1 phospholipase D family protein [Roseomonas sp. KE0001]
MLHAPLRGTVPAMAPIVAGEPPRPSEAVRAVGRMTRSLGTASGAALVPGGLEAFMLRAVMARAAGHGLDLQYYRWSDDVTGGLLAREVLRAADRGVRVRILLDDSYVLGPERRIALLDVHPRIELRLFNTARFRFLGQFGLGLEFALGGWHLNHRMHNKNWVVDGAMALVGGRNIADAYFDGAGDFNFRDLDMLIAGQAAQQAQRVFDSYWASSLARPVERFRRVARRASQEALAAFRAELDAIPETAKVHPYLQALRAEHGRWLERDHALLPVPEDGPEGLRVLSDPPAKAQGRGVPGGVAPAVEAMLLGARREALLISPYFVPGEAGMAVIEALARRGVAITVITNSLAATDVVAVHSGYARYRPRLVELGVALHELKRSGRHDSGVFGSKGASLHTKALMVDGDQVFVGSFNLDPRSANLNTEMGAFARHPGLAEKLAVERDRLCGPERSYRVTRDPRGHLLWTDDEGSTAHEPEAPLARRALARLVRWLPIEAQL